jgi:hypothetical protein
VRCEHADSEAVCSLQKGTLCDKIIVKRVLITKQVVAVWILTPCNDVVVYKSENLIFRT